jgi:hypothetical protein
MPSIVHTARTAVTIAPPGALIHAGTGGVRALKPGVGEFLFSRCAQLSGKRGDIGHHQQIARFKLAEALDRGVHHGGDLFSGGEHQHQLALFEVNADDFGVDLNGHGALGVVGQHFFVLICMRGANDRGGKKSGGQAGTGKQSVHVAISS